MNLPVLVLEKDLQVRSLIRVVLSKHGYPTLEAQDASSALAFVKNFNGALTIIVGSLSMSDIARLVKAYFPGTSILLMFSGATEGDGLPGDAFLGKPFHPFELVDTVRCLQEKQLQEANDKCN
jgi:DNA-binding response OmpR family regulator